MIRSWPMLGFLQLATAQLHLRSGQGLALLEGGSAQEPECRCVVLQEASHQLVMITGDTPLTACHAAKQVHIVDRPVLILDYHRSAPVWRLTVPYTSIDSIDSLSNESVHTVL